MYEFDQYPPEGVPGKELSEKPYIHSSCRLRDVKIGSWTALGANTSMFESSFGDYSYTAGNVSIAYATIGKFCSIANSVRINPGNHPQWRVTQHHFTYRRASYKFGDQDDNAFFQWRRDHHCEIGHDTWIGHGAIVMPGVKVGIGCVIGSGAVVTKDLPDYAVAVGVPAKVIKFRFSEEVRERLIASQWWDWDRETLESRFNDLLELDQFLSKYGEPKSMKLS